MAAARARVATAEAALSTASTLPNPRLEVTPEYVTNTDESSPWSITTALDLLIPTGSRRARSSELFEQRIELARLDVGSEAWRIYVEVRSAWNELGSIDKELELTHAELELLDAIAHQIDARLQAGAAARIEVDAARGAVARTRAGLIALEGSRTATRARLAAAIGLVPAALDAVELRFDAPLPRPQESAHSVLDRLDLRRLLAEYEEAERALALELARQYPDLHLGPGYQYDQGENHYILGIGVELPVFDRNQGPIAEALSHRDEVAARFEAGQSRALGEIAAARAAVDAARATLLSFDSGALEVAAQRERHAQELLDAGALDRLALLEVRVERFAILHDRLLVERSLTGALAELEDALQRPLDPEMEPPQDAAANLASLQKAAR